MGSGSAAVGLVVVSHSRALGEAAAGLAREMVPGDAVRIAVAAGLDEHTLGTDATAIAEALISADSGAGVVVLMDLGSAVLSAELACEFVDDPTRVLLCPAPLVEGLVAAAVAAAGGADREAVAAEAMAGVAAKLAQLEPPDHAAATDQTDRGSASGTAGRPDPAAPTDVPDEVAEVGRFVVTPAHGLHARPAALLARTVAGFDARVALSVPRTGRGPVPAAGLTGIASLGAVAGDEVEVVARGPEAAAAVAAVLALATDGFGEAPAAPVVAEPAAGPVAGVPGIVVGAVRVLRATRVEVPDEVAGPPAAERARLDEALVVADAAITATRDATAGPEAAIFDTHLAMLADPALLDDARARIDAGAAAPAAWAAAVAAVEAQLAALPDEYLRARAADVRAVGEEVLRALVSGGGAGHAAARGATDHAAGAPAADAAGAATDDADRDRERVLVAADLTPAEAATLRADGVVLAGGSPTSHAVILLRSRGIPTVLGAGPAVLDLAEGTVVALDGEAGTLVVEPDEAERRAAEARRTGRAARERAAVARLDEPAVTTDGVRVLVGVNVGAEPVTAPGADLAGLVRTELLFLDRDTPPTVDEQVAAYRAVADALGNRRIVLRTLDVGGDKPLRYLPRPPEANPFLGVRGLRLALRSPDLLHDQLCAVVRTARETPVSVMFPMVTVPAELRAARAALRRAQEAVGPADLEVGIMVETPAAALTAAVFDVDFFSVGTNDLTQYVMAAERGNPQLGDLADPLSPAVLALVARVCATGVPTAVCGELAADPRATGLLVSLGVRELSVAPPAVARIKQAVRETAVTPPPDLWTTPDAAAVRASLPEA